MPCVVSCRRSEARCSALFVASDGCAMGERCMHGFARICNVMLARRCVGASVCVMSVVRATQLVLVLDTVAVPVKSASRGAHAPLELYSSAPAHTHPL